MKTFGWLCLLFGGLSFLGAVIKGDSVFGPVFFLGLGLFFVHRSNQKKQERKDKDDWVNK